MSVNKGAESVKSRIRWDKLIGDRNELCVVLIVLFAMFFAGCASQSEIGTEATASDDAVEVEDTEITTTTEAIAQSTEAEAGDDAADGEETDVATDVEPNFELTGELELTTAEINDMVAFVETSAGREFLRPPIIQVVSVEEFEAGLVPDPEFEAELAEFNETAARFQQALGHTSQGVEEYNAALDDIGTSTELISGRYDPFDDVVIIPEGVLEGDDFNAILVHELLHALDGQYVDLASLIEQMQSLATEEIASDTAFQIAAVVEGRASVTQFEWMEANGVVPTAQDIPEAFDTVQGNVINQVALPYQLGAQTIFQLGGVEATWDLYDNFPTSSEQMIFSARIGADEPITVEAPAVDGEVFYEGVFGAEGMILLGLGDNLEPNQLEVITALSAAEGWGGDYFVLSGDEAQSCFTGAIVADSEEDLTELSDLFADWAARETVHGAERTADLEGDTVTIRSCAPFVS